MYESPGLSGLLAELVSVERAQARLGAHRVRVLAAIQAAELAARAVEAAARTGSASVSSVERDRHWVSEEVAQILRVAGVTAQDRLLHAYQLVTRLNDSVRLLEAGGVHPLQVHRLSEAVLGLDDEQCADVQSRMLARVAADPGLSITAFTRSLRRAVLRAAPRTAEQAYTDALNDLRVEVRALDHGIGLLMAWLPMPDALRIKAAVDSRAKPAGSAGSDGSAGSAGLAGRVGEDACRLVDVRRAYAFIELVDLGAVSDPARVPARAAPAVAVTVSLQTLLGVSDEPGELSGYGPIPASLARGIAADPNSTWRRLVTDPLGRLIDYGRNVYKPPPGLDAFVRARDQTCTFPNCHRRAITCDLDHIQAWNDHGRTNHQNLTAVCPRHHHAKHDAGWKPHRDPTTGITQWTSPTGNHYLNHPAELPGSSTSRLLPGSSRKRLLPVGSAQT